MLGTALTALRQKKGQAMVETTIALIFVLIVFLALFNLADLTRTKLLVENAAVKCARARAVGYNDFMLRKIARLATMPAAGRCLTPSDDGTGTLSRSDRYNRIGDYLMSEYDEQADAILDFEYWQNGDTAISATVGSSPVTATVSQRRPRLFDFGVLTGAVNPDTDSRATISASSTQEAHYPDYLQ
jgi:Flp pilus assembly protein TadG